ncbi:MAG TPA: ATP-binding protein, partial [Lamprocystis sp. (in: g-proteobacteria)]|nr:ATP-binding protein [Lamprocystis sp. (in: g-proteobacteria)]
MTIRNRFRLILGVIVLMAVLRSGLVLYLNSVQQEVMDYEDRASEMLSLIVQLGVVTLDYRLTKEARPFALTRRKIDQLGEVLAQLPPGEPSDQPVVARLQRNFVGLQASITKLATARADQEAAAVPTADAPTIAVDNETLVYRLANRLSAEANDMAAGARKLLDTHRERSRYLATLTGQVTLGFDLLTALVILGLLLTQSRSLLRSLEALRRGAQAVAAGQPGVQVTTPARDELGELAETFNRMAEQLEHRQAQLEALHGHLADLNRDLEQRVARRTAELTAAMAQRQQTITELNQRNEELRQFAYVASHDLQEPLRMVASYTDLLKRRHAGAFDAEGERYLGYVLDGARRMQELILELLAYSRVGTRGKPPVPIPLDAPLDAALADLTLRIAETGAVITRGPLPSLPVEREQLHQIFQNLIGNALKFRGLAPPLIGIDAVPSEGAWRIEVRDNGIGISPEHHERIFNLFARLHSRAAYAGTGIGLAVCRRIVERHGGRIWVESSLGAGATFSFTLP